MPSRRTILQGAGALVGQAAAHGTLYGELHRERILYRNQAKMRLDDLGRINDEEWELVRQEALRKGERQILEAGRKGKVDHEAVEDALNALPGAIEDIIDWLKTFHG